MNIYEKLGVNQGDDAAAFDAFFKSCMVCIGNTVLIGLMEVDVARSQTFITPEDVVSLFQQINRPYIYLVDHHNPPMLFQPGKEAVAAQKIRTFKEDHQRWEEAEAKKRLKTRKLRNIRS